MDSNVVEVNEFTEGNEINILTPKLEWPVKVILSWVKKLWTNAQAFSQIFKLDRPRLLFSLFLSFQHSRMWIKIVNDWIRTADFWCQKWLLYQLCHNHWGPLESAIHNFISSFEAFSELFHLKLNTIFTSSNGLAYFDVIKSRALQ